MNSAGNCHSGCVMSPSAPSLGDPRPLDSPATWSSIPPQKSGNPGGNPGGISQKNPKTSQFSNGSFRNAMKYPLVMTNIAMENHHFQWENPLQMVIFHSYVKLPEGTLKWTNVAFSTSSKYHEIP